MYNGFEDTILFHERVIIQIYKDIHVTQAHTRYSQMHTTCVCVCIRYIYIYIYIYFMFYIVECTMFVLEFSIFYYISYVKSVEASSLAISPAVFLFGPQRALLILKLLTLQCA